MQARIVLVTCPAGGQGAAIAHELVETGLAACVNIVPGLQSIYRWQGKIEQDNEALLVIKTSIERLADLEQTVLARHPYETPEFVVLCPEQINEKYLQWLLGS